jgi:Uri superfamily endonuclease
MKGSYILVVYIERDIQIEVGALGFITFKKGFYFYIGSAMGEYGSSTLLTRVKRHFLSKNEKKIHWHIDYLLADVHSMIIKIYLVPSKYPLECIIARELSEISDGLIKNFGSSDCNCKSHLFYIKNLKYFEKKTSNK